MLLAHGKAVQTIRARARKPATIGVAQVGGVRAPASDSLEDVGAAQQAMFSVNESTHFNHAWFGDTMVLGRYPESLLARFGLIYVDFLTQRRSLKDSAHWYRAVIESNGRILAERESRQ